MIIARYGQIFDQSERMHLCNHLIMSNNYYIKEIKKCTKCIVELYIKHVGFFKNKREVPEKHELQANSSRSSQVFLKSPKCLYNSTMYEEQVFYFFYKMYREFCAHTDDVGYMHYISTVHWCGVMRMLYGNIMNLFDQSWHAHFSEHFIITYI